jgi:NitT/TauT family transport system substrate-binding protein
VSIISLFVRYAAATAALGLAVLSAPGSQAENVKIGVVGTTSDAPFFIAEAKGYFRDEGLTVEFVKFDSGVRMVAVLGIGDLDVGGGATSAALYNAAKRDVNIKIVADKARTSKGYAFEAFLVRRQLYDSGKVRSFKDLKGLRISVNLAGTSEAVLLDKAVRLGGLKPTDIDPVYLSFAQQVTAFQNNAIDAAISAEPFVSYTLKQGTAVKLIGVDEYAPDFQNAVTFFGAKFAKEKPEPAKKFSRAFVRAVRFYNDALKDGQLRGPNAEDVISIMMKYATLKDAETYREFRSHGVHPDGLVNVDSLKESWQFFKDTGQIDGSVGVEEIVDLSFIRAAAAELGPYQAKPK